MIPLTPLFLYDFCKNRGLPCAVAVTLFIVTSCSDDLERVAPETPTEKSPPTQVPQAIYQTPPPTQKPADDWFQQRIQESVERTRNMSNKKLHDSPKKRKSADSPE